MGSQPRRRCTVKGIGLRLLAALVPGAVYAANAAAFGPSGPAALIVSDVGGIATAFAVLAAASSVTLWLRVRRLRRALGRAAEWRDAQLRLRAALLRAEAAVEMRDRLVANVSHELRSPLNVIIGYSDMLLEATSGDASAMIAHVVPRIRDYAVALEGIVGELLTLSRLSSYGSVKLTPTDIDVPALLDEVASGTRALLGDKPVEVHVECDVPRFRCDRMRVRQILTNLMTNAAKFTVEGRIVLTARAQRDGVGFYVSDTGCGIPASKHEAIFCAFEQVAPGGRGGVGLGLTIVRQITDLLGGTVNVTSAPGVGSSFAVALPHGAAARSYESVHTPSERKPFVLLKSQVGQRGNSVGQPPIVQRLIGCTDPDRLNGIPNFPTSVAARSGAQRAGG